MSRFDHRKYRSFKPIALVDRQWPDKVITQAPIWCSVDLRDGNQALLEPMTVEQKQAMFAMLINVGFKEIEVGFPAASQPDFDFVRWLIEEDQVPDDVTLQVLTQARPELIERTFESLKGARRAIVHLYNSTSTVQREQVFQLDREGIKQIAVNGAIKVKQMAGQFPQTDWQFQYSPESFTGTELDYAVEVVDAVNAVWQPTVHQPTIINLPATVEMSTPNIFADQIEWFCKHVQHRDSIVLSVHTHNDRGCGIAAAELAVMAGADRVEGTMLGNGERTGNMDIVTMAMNLYSQGIDPALQLGDMDEIIRVVKACTALPVHPRHPYAGELVYTAFSGSHQDAIKKCLDRRQPDDVWEVAYLPIDPMDLGRNYQDVVRINSQSGKGGIAYSLARDHGLQLPRNLQIAFSSVVQKYAEQQGGEVNVESIWQLFSQQYIEQQLPLHLNGFTINSSDVEDLEIELSDNGSILKIESRGHGSIDAFINALRQYLDVSINIQEYSEHALQKGSDSDAVSYIQLKIAGEISHGVAINEDTITASFNAIIVAINRYLIR